MKPVLGAAVDMFGGIGRLPGMLGRWHQQSGHAIVRWRGRTTFIVFFRVSQVGGMHEDAYVQELGDDGS